MSSSLALLLLDTYNQLSYNICGSPDLRCYCTFLHLKERETLHSLTMHCAPRTKNVHRISRKAIKDVLGGNITWKSKQNRSSHIAKIMRSCKLHARLEQVELIRNVIALIPTFITVTRRNSILSWASPTFISISCTTISFYHSMLSINLLH